MNIVLTVLQWLKGHWRLLGSAVAAFGAVYAASMRQGRAAKEKVQADVAADETKLSVETVAIEQGAAAAHQKVAEQYKETLAKLDVGQQAEASKLLNDPVALAKFLVDQNEVAP